MVVFALFPAVSCHRSPDVINEPQTGANSASGETEGMHKGIVELVQSVKKEGFKTIALAQEANSLLVLDDGIIDRPGTDLEVLSMADLKCTATFAITKEMSRNYPWSSSSLAVDGNGSHALIYNQYIELDPVQVAASLDIESVLGRPAVCPEAWSISPDGKRGLVRIWSYLTADECTLATFDLSSGKLLGKVAVGANLEGASACFLDDETVVIVRANSDVTFHTASGEPDGALPERITLESFTAGNYLRLSPFANGKRLLISSQDEILVLGIPERSVLFRHPCYSGNAVVTYDGKWVIWQFHRSAKPDRAKGTPGFSDNSLMVANADNGKIVGKYELTTFFEMLTIDNASEYIFAANYSGLHMLKIDLSPLAGK